MFNLTRKENQWFFPQPISLLGEKYQFLKEKKNQLLLERWTSIGTTVFVDISGCGKVEYIWEENGFTLHCLLAWLLALLQR